MTEETEATTTPSTVQTVTETRATAGAVAPAVDWDSAPVYEEAVREETVVTAVQPAHKPRGRWDFTNAQRIILALLLWLNIMVIVLGILLVTGRLTL